MKIVIYIQDEKYKVIQDGNYCGLLDDELYYAIKNGTPLPKGHGRLIDAKWLKTALHNFSKGLNRNADWEDIYCYIDAAPTIIEADKEGTDAT